MKTPPRHPGPAAGMTMVEVAMGLFLFGLVFVGLTSYTAVHRKALSRQDLRSEAMAIALSRMEREKVTYSNQVKFASIIAGTPVNTTDTITGRSAGFRWYCYATAFSVPENLVKIRLKVRGRAFTSNAKDSVEIIFLKSRE